MLPLKWGNMLHTIMLQKSQDVTRSLIASAARSQSATCVLLHCPNALKLCRHYCFGQSMSALGQCRSAQVALWERSAVAVGERVRS